MIRLFYQQTLPISLETAWDFFSTPANLNEITPPDMSFEITSELPEKMYEGLFITYKISPIPLMKFDWCTEITHVSPLSYFVDEQRSGPYNIWHHEHHFEEVSTGVLMTDLLHYDIGKGLLGKIAGSLFVHQKVSSIFEYRKKKLFTIFPTIPDSVLC